MAPGFVSSLSRDSSDALSAQAFVELFLQCLGHFDAAAVRQQRRFATTNLKVIAAAGVGGSAGQDAHQLGTNHATWALVAGVKLAAVADLLINGEVDLGQTVADQAFALNSLQV